LGRLVIAARRRNAHGPNVVVISAAIAGVTRSDC
jgi:hypothetical protein